MTNQSAEDHYSKLLKSEITYQVSTADEYTHLTSSEREKVIEYILSDTHEWDFTPIAHFIRENIPTTFTKNNFKRLRITFDKDKYLNGEYTISGLNRTLYQHYLLHFDYTFGSEPVSFDEFTTNELTNDDYLESINGMRL